MSLNRKCFLHMHVIWFCVKKILMNEIVKIIFEKNKKKKKEKRNTSNILLFVGLIPRNMPKTTVRDVKHRSELRREERKKEDGETVFYTIKIAVITLNFVGGWVGRWCWVASSAGVSCYFGIWKVRGLLCLQQVQDEWAMFYNFFNLVYPIFLF